MKRVGFAVLLVAAAVVIPTGAWYVVGQRDAAREAKNLREEALGEAREASHRLAATLAARLEGIRDTENLRPYFHYQNLYHDPRGAYVGASVQLSPLAEGNYDPLLAGHFQIDAKGRVTMPTVNPEHPELNTAFKSRSSSDTLLAAIEARAGEIRDAAEQRDAALARLVRKTETVRETVTPTPRVVAAVTASPTATPTAVAQQQAVPQQQNKSRVAQVQRLEPEQWAYNQSANSLYSEIRSRRGLPVAQKQAEVLDNLPAATPTPTPAADASRPRTRTHTREVIIEVGTLDWHTLDVGGRPTIAALRLVRTPAGPITQGFVVSQEAVGDLLDSSAFSAHLSPGAPASPLETSLGVDGLDWSVGVSADEAMAAADAGARTLEAQFRGTFLSGAAVAMLAGLALILLVWKSEQLARQRSRFAASAAHELRTPLAGIRMYGEMLAEGLGDPERNQEYAGRVASEADRLARIVKNVLGFTRLEQGKLSVRVEPGDLRATVRMVCSQLEPSLRSAGADLTVRLPDSLPDVSFDRDAVSQIVQNLLDNAEKYTRDSEDRRIELELKRVADQAHLTIRDHGPGVSVPVRRRVFRAFSRGEQPDAPAGLGLGLSLAQGLARAQDGDLAYSDAPGGGAAFTLRLPLALY